MRAPRCYASLATCWSATLMPLPTLISLISLLCLVIGAGGSTEDLGMMSGEEDPAGLWIVYGNTLDEGGSFLTGLAEIRIQPRDAQGQDVPIGSDAQRVSISIDPPQSDHKLTVDEGGAMLLSFRWRLAGVAKITIQYDGRHISKSPYSINVLERYIIEPGGVADVGGISATSPHTADDAVYGGAGAGTRLDADFEPGAGLATGESGAGDGGRDGGGGKAYATIITNDAFCTGALVLHHTIMLTLTKYPTIALVTPSVSTRCRHLLSTSGLRILQVSPLPNPNAFHKAHFRDVYAKLHVFGLAQFSRVIYVDADMLVLRNIDALFESSEPLSATSEINPPILFNSGLMVLEPSRELFTRLTATAALLPSYDKTDQGLLNELHMGVWNPLPYTYNFLKDRGALPDRFDKYVKDHLDDVHVVHMVGEKPWLCSSDQECNVQGRLSPRLWHLWLHFFQDMCGAGQAARIDNLFTCTDLASVA